jgi:ribosomal protein S18 acetylase RimI-like enzyme
VVEKLVAERFSVSRLTKLLERQRSEFLVADDGRRSAAWLSGRPTGDDARIVVELDMLIVRPDQQGRGIGGMLLEEFEQSFFESELSQLEVERAGRARTALLLDAGYAEIGRKTGPIVRRRF